VTDITLEFDYLTRRRSFDQLVELAHAAYAGRPRSTATTGDVAGFPRGYVGAWIEDRLVGCHPALAAGRPPRGRFPDRRPERA
jgi:hypothetical protein